MQRRILARAWLPALALLLMAVSARAGDIIIDVEFDSSNLAAAVPPTTPFYLSYTLIDIEGNFNENLIKVDGFNVAGSGSPVFDPANTGASGSIATGFALADAGVLASVYEEFAVGALLKFTITVREPVVFSGSNPDRFVFSILYGSVPDALPTTDPSDSALLAFDLKPGLPSIETYGSPSSGAVVDFKEPRWRIRQTGIVPEPTSVAMLASGLAGLGLLGLRRRRAA